MNDQSINENTKFNHCKNPIDSVEEVVLFLKTPRFGMNDENNLI